jgi:hypothetical protein
MQVYVHDNDVTSALRALKASFSARACFAS